MSAPKAFVTQLQVRFGDVDPAGIAYYPKIFELIHLAFEELWDVHVGRRYYHLIREDEIGFPLVHADVNFLSPLRFGDRPVVRVTCFRLGRSSIGLRYVFSVAERECIDARMTVACVELRGLASHETPPEYRARFEEIYREDPA